MAISDRPDWVDIDTEYDWLAMDSDGCWFAYDREPTWAAVQQCWDNMGGAYIEVFDDGSISGTYMIDAQISLRCRIGPLGNDEGINKILPQVENYCPVCAYGPTHMKHCNFCGRDRYEA